MWTMCVLGGHQSKLSNSVNKLLAKSVHFQFLTTLTCQQEVRLLLNQPLRKLNPHDFELCWDKQQHDTSLQTKEEKKEIKIPGNSIKLQLEASDKFMEIKVLCKSVVCLAPCQITRGCTILHSNEQPQKTQQLRLTSPKTTLHAIQTVHCIF